MDTDDFTPLSTDQNESGINKYFIGLSVSTFIYVFVVSNKRIKVAYRIN